MWQDRRNDFDLYSSDFVIEEASRGDPTAVAERLKVLADISLLAVNQESLELSKQLVTAMALPPRGRLDAAHVAISAVYGVNFLLTWNCRHLANAMLTAKIETACASAGFTAPKIVTPEMLLEVPG
jgi:hypothetical protein